MKSKTKFDPKVIQQFFIDHTEKFVFGLVAAVFLFFAYQSVTLSGYAKKPDELQRATEAATSQDQPVARRPASLKWKPRSSPTPTIIESARSPVDARGYPMPPCLNWKPIPPRRPRDAPDVFAVEKLRAIAGRGAIAKDNNSGTAGKRWVVVTGLVPYKKQLDEYRAKFEGAAWNDPHEDVPKYIGYFVQRAEVGAAATGGRRWTKFWMFPPFDPKESAAEAARPRAKEIVDARFLRFPLTAPPSLAAPLPLLMDSTWGKEAAFPPQIPLLEVEAADGEPTKVPAGGSPAGGGEKPSPPPVPSNWIRP